MCQNFDISHYRALHFGALACRAITSGMPQPWPTEQLLCGHCFDARCSPDGNEMIASSWIVPSLTSLACVNEVSGRHPRSHQYVISGIIKKASLLYLKRELHDQ